MSRLQDRRSGSIKGDRALELHEKGLSPTVISDRLGVSLNHVGLMVARARARREKLIKRDDN